MMSADTCAIAAVSSAEPGQPGTAYAEHLAQLLPAAQAAGLTHVLQIVAVNGPGTGDQFLYYATRAEADAARSSWVILQGSELPCKSLRMIVRSWQSWPFLSDPDGVSTDSRAGCQLCSPSYSD
jgi:hypothetical protein